MIGFGETTDDLDCMFHSSTFCADFQPLWVSLVKGNIKLLPVSAMEPILYLARTWTGEPGPAHCNIAKLEEENLLLLLCGKAIVMQKSQSAAVAGGFSCQERAQ